MVKEKLLDEFHQMLEHYFILLDHYLIIYGIARKYLTNFPEGLPEEIVEAMKVDKKICEEEHKRQLRLQKKFPRTSDAILEGSKEVGKVISQLKEPVTYPIINLISRKRLFESRGKNVDDYYDLNYSRNAQIMVMYNSMLEGFLLQAIRLIFKLDKSIKKERLKKSLKWRLDFLKEKCDFRIKEKSPILKILYDLEEIRHIIVHNSGIIDHTFIDKTGYKDFLIGVKIQLDGNLVAFCGFAMNWLISEFYYMINEKYFKEFQKKQVTMEFRPDGFRVINNGTEKG